MVVFNFGGLDSFKRYLSNHDQNVVVDEESVGRNMGLCFSDFSKLIIIDLSCFFVFFKSTEKDSLRKCSNDSLSSFFTKKKNVKSGTPL